jgi:hypothetical protein
MEPNNIWSLKQPESNIMTSGMRMLESRCPGLGIHRANSLGFD